MKRTLLIKERKRRDLRQVDVADAVGIEKSHYAGIELGKHNPSLNIACKLENFFNIPICTLLQRDGADDNDN